MAGIEHQKAVLEYWDSLTPSKRNALLATAMYLQDGGWGLNPPAKFAMEWIFILDHEEVLAEIQRLNESRLQAEAMLKGEEC